MTFDPTLARQQFDKIKDYPIDLQVSGHDLLAMLHVAQHVAFDQRVPGQTIETMLRLGKQWQALLADPTTDFGQMIQAGWVLPPTPAPGPEPSDNKPAQQLQEHLAVADRTAVFELASHLENAFGDYVQQRANLTNADIIMGLQNFYLWIIFYLEASIQDESGALRKAIVDTLITRIRQKEQPQ